MPMTDIPSIHADPVGPMRINSNSLALVAEDAVEDVLPFVEPSVPFMLEARHLDGALATGPTSDNAVGHRAARLNLFSSAHPGTRPGPAAAAQQDV